MCCQVKKKKVHRTFWHVAYREAVLDTVAGLSVTPTLQAGVFLLRRLQHVVTAETLKEKKGVKYFMSQTLIGSRVTLACCRYHSFVFYSTLKSLEFGPCSSRLFEEPKGQKFLAELKKSSFCCTTMTSFSLYS